MLTLRILQASGTKLRRPYSGYTYSRGQIRSVRILYHRQNIRLHLRCIVRKVSSRIRALRKHVSGTRLLRNRQGHTFRRFFMRILCSNLLTLRVIGTTSVHPRQLVRLLRRFNVFLRDLLLRGICRTLRKATRNVIIRGLMINGRHVRRQANSGILYRRLSNLYHIRKQIGISLRSLRMFIRHLFICTKLSRLKCTLSRLIHSGSSFLYPILPVRTITTLLRRLNVRAILRFTRAGFRLPNSFHILRLPHFFLSLSLLGTRPQPTSNSKQHMELLIKFLLIRHGLIRRHVRAIVIKTRHIRSFPSRVRNLTIIRYFLHEGVKQRSGESSSMPMLLLIKRSLIRDTRRTTCQLRRVRLQIANEGRRRNVGQQRVRTLKRATRINRRTTLTIVIQLIHRPLRSPITLLQIRQTICILYYCQGNVQGTLHVRVLIMLL